MMNSSEVFDVIEKIAATSSKNEKEALIKQHSNDENFKRVLVAALNPFVTYGIKQLPAAQEDGVQDFSDIHWTTLDMLSKRVLSGSAAFASVKNVLDNLNPKSTELFRRILLKDLRAGFSESTANKAISGLVPTFDCMLAHKFSEHKHKLKFPLYVEPKLDGVRVLTFVTAMGESVKFYSRSGKEFTTFEHLKAPVGKMVTNWLVANTINMKWFLEEAGAGLVIEAEVVSGSFNKTVSEVRRKDEQATDAVLCMFDVLPLATFTREEKKGCELAGPWLKRRQRIEQLMTYAPMTTSLRLLETQKVNSEEEIHTMYEEFRAKGLEGAIVKDPIALYHRRRNHAWTKIKAEESVDVPITGAIEGTGKYQGKLGALVVNYNGVAVNVGSGLSDEQREEFWDAHKRDEQRCADGEDGIPVDDFELLNRTIEVEYHEVTPDGSLRHPRFKRFRDDKAVQS